MFPQKNLLTNKADFGVQMVDTPRNWSLICLFVLAILPVAYAWNKKKKQRRSIENPATMQELRNLREKYFDSYTEPPPIPQRRWTPIETVFDLLAWKGPSTELLVQAKAAPKRTAMSNKSKYSLLVCHDMAGNYADDCLVDGWYATSTTNNKNPNWAWGFRPTHFAWMKTFVYFSHKLVCVPPAGWIFAAHKHGCEVLGTLMTEFEQGEAECCDLFMCAETALLAADRLNAIRLEFGFEGWLINIENKLSVTEQIPNVYLFLESLSSLGSRVVWYDSVLCTTGELKWQNGLTANNIEFFNRSNAGILTNYGWGEERAKQSNENAAERVSDVWHGIDVFGRGTLGGGGFNCHVALDALERVGSKSACLFAPGWVLESECKCDATIGREKQLEFWERMLNKTAWGYLNEAYPAPMLDLTKSALYTDFCDGGGAAMYFAGKRLHNKPWLDLRRHMLQPRWDVLTLSEANNVKTQMRVTIRTTETLPQYAGNVCLQIVGRNSKAQEDWCFFPVLSVDARIGGARGPASVLRIKAALFALHGDAALSLKLAGESNTNNVWLMLTPMGYSKGVAACTEESVGGWIVRTWEVRTYEHRKRSLQEVGISALLCDGTITWVDVRLGMISLDETLVDCTLCTPSNLKFDFQSRVLTWQCACGSPTCSVEFAHVHCGDKVTCAFANEYHLTQHDVTSLSVSSVRWDGSESAQVSFTE